MPGSQGSGPTVRPWDAWVGSRRQVRMLDELENAHHGQGPDPVASFDGEALQAILAAVRDLNAAQDRIASAVAQARDQGAS